jgi:hypothetical protein
MKSLDPTLDAFVTRIVNYERVINKKFTDGNQKFQKNLDNQLDSYFEMLKKFLPDPSYQKASSKLKDRVTNLHKSINDIKNNLIGQFQPIAKGVILENEETPTSWPTNFHNIIRPVVEKALEDISTQVKLVKDTLNTAIAKGKQKINVEDNQKIDEILIGIAALENTAQAGIQDYLTFITPKRTTKRKLPTALGMGAIVAQPNQTAEPPKRQRNTRITFSDNVTVREFFFDRRSIELEETLINEAFVGYPDVESRMNQQWFQKHPHAKKTYDKRMKELFELPPGPVTTEGIVLKPNSGLKDLLAKYRKDSSAAAPPAVASAEGKAT